MDKLSYHRRRYPSIVIQQAIWFYFRFSMSYRDVEDMTLHRLRAIAESRLETIIRAMPVLRKLMPM